MKISNLSLYKVSLDQWSGESRYGPQQKLDSPLEANIVRLETETGLVGWGESCVAPPFYLPTLAPAAREAIKYIAPLVVGANATNPRVVLNDIDTAMRGQGPAKAAIDMALWDLCGKMHGLQVCELWGGRVTAELPVLAMVSIGTPDQTVQRMQGYREQGYSIFQIKIGLGSAEEDVEKIIRVIEALRPGERTWFDVNRGWSVDDAMQVIPKVKHLSPLIEQPCESYEECLTISQRLGIGLMLDESIDSPEAMIQAKHDGVIDVAVLKMGCTGGLSKHKFLVDLGTVLRIPMRIEDYYGTGLTMAAVTHLAHTLPAQSTFALYDYHMPELPLVNNPLVVKEGKTKVPEDAGPGLGYEINESLLGEPTAVIKA